MIYFILLTVYLIFLIIFSIIQIPADYGYYSIEFYIIHALYYLILAWLFLMVFKSYKINSYKLAILFSIFISVYLELLQVLTLTRSFDFLDIIANVMGAFSVLLWKIY